MKKIFCLVILVYITVLLFGCSSIVEQRVETIVLEGNPTTGFTWVYTMSPEGVVREISNEYIADNTRGEIVGAGGQFVFVFEAIAAGEAELVFSYLRVWERDVPPLSTVMYKAIVDEKNNLTMIQK